jgi:NAD-dependent dihydropyrimidine dehydrogenase PreA subunit
MADIQGNKVSDGVDKAHLSSQSHRCHEEAAGEPSGTDASKGPVKGVPADESTETEQDIGTACYLCYGQCVNYGVEGIKGRPCAKGFTEIIDRHRKGRRGVRTGRQSGV